MRRVGPRTLPLMADEGLKQPGQMGGFVRVTMSESLGPV